MTQGRSVGRPFSRVRGDLVERVGGFSAWVDESQIGTVGRSAGESLMRGEAKAAV
jgi:hypothetical protein